MLRSHLLTSTKQNGIITPLDLMAVFFLVQPSVWFALLTAKVCCWLVCVLSPTVTPGSFQQSSQFVSSPCQFVGTPVLS